MLHAIPHRQFARDGLLFRSGRGVTEGFQNLCVPFVACFASATSESSGDTGRLCAGGMVNSARYATLERSIARHQENLET